MSFFTVNKVLVLNTARLHFGCIICQQNGSLREILLPMKNSKPAKDQSFWDEISVEIGPRNYYARA